MADFSEDTPPGNAGELHQAGGSAHPLLDRIPAASVTEALQAGRIRGREPFLRQVH